MVTVMQAIRNKIFPRNDMHAKALQAADELIAGAKGLREELEDLACNKDPIGELVQRIHRCKSGDCADDRN
jgi:hypothetical protein